MDKQLNKAYEKRLKTLSKEFFINNSTGLLLYVEYLKYLRDVFILKSYNNDCNRLRVTTLNTAIAEFNAYEKSKSDDIKRFHWNNFCELVRLNMEDWLASNDSI